jgi:hypothetical protein
MTQRIADAIIRLQKLGRFQIAFSGLTALSTSFVGISTYSVNLPAPEVYLKYTIAGKCDRNPPKDPKCVVKFRNNGGCPMVLEEITLHDGKNTVKNFTSGLHLSEKSNFVVSSESDKFLEGGYKGRNFNSKSSMIWCTLRPTNTSVETTSWCDECSSSFNRITVKIKYSYFSLPMYGPIFSSEKVCCL